MEQLNIDPRTRPEFRTALEETRRFRWDRLSFFIDIFSDLDYRVSPLECKEISRLCLKSATSFFPYLTSLDLTWQRVDDEGVEYLAQGLRRNQLLKRLELGYNGITDKGARFLAQALQYNDALKSLELQENYLTDVAVFALAEALVFNNSLIRLILDYNELTLEGLKALERKLMYNYKIEQLSLLGNNIDPQALSNFIIPQDRSADINLETLAQETEMGEHLKILSLGELAVEFYTKQIFDSAQAEQLTSNDLNLIISPRKARFVEANLSGSLSGIDFIFVRIKRDDQFF